MVLMVGVSLGVAIGNFARQTVRAQAARCAVPKTFGTLKTSVTGFEARALRMPKSTAHLVFEDPDGVVRLVALDGEACNVTVTINRP
jgi:hypothetical protein